MPIRLILAMAALMTSALCQTDTKLKARELFLTPLPPKTAPARVKKQLPEPRKTETAKRTTPEAPRPNAVEWSW
jgi:hypothetical protein